MSSVTLGIREVKCTELSTKLEGEAAEGEKDWRHQLEIDSMRNFEVYEKKVQEKIGKDKVMFSYLAVFSIVLVK